MGAHVLRGHFAATVPAPGHSSCPGPGQKRDATAVKRTDTLVTHNLEGRDRMAGGGGMQRDAGCARGSTPRVPGSGFKGLKLKRYREIFPVGGGNPSSKRDGMCPKRAGVGRSNGNPLTSLHGIRGVGTASPHPGTGKLRHRARQGSGNTRGCMGDPLPLRGSAEPVVEVEETRTLQRGWFAGVNTPMGSPSPLPILAQGHPGGTPLPPPCPVQLWGRGPPVSDAGANLLCRRSSGRGQGRRELLGCPPAAADLRGML